MSTSNFDSRVKFGIYVFNPNSYTSIYKICTCDCYNYVNYGNVDICEECGADITNEEVYTDYDYDNLSSYEVPMITNGFENLNCLFHAFKFESGYYDGVQLIVYETSNLEDLEDGYLTRCEFDLYPSQAKRKFLAEERKIKKWLKSVCENYCIDELKVDCVFSNGETWYSKVA